MRIYLILTDYSGDSSWRLDIKPFVAECPHSSSSNSPPRLCLLLACKNNGRSKTMAIKFKWSIGKWPRDANTKFDCQTRRPHRWLLHGGRRRGPGTYKGDYRHYLCWFQNAKIEFFSPFHLLKKVSLFYECGRLQHHWLLAF